jgi:hypothetical protein
MAASATMSVMAYEFDEQARQEAAEHRLSEYETGRLKDQCARKATALGPDGVRADTVSFSAAAWDEPPGLPVSIPRTGCITRGDVLDLGEQVRDGALHATDLLAASLVWGWGSTGFGPRRYRDILAAAGDQLEPSLQRVLTAINKDPGSPDPIVGYAQFYGGHCYETRAAPGQEPWSRLRGFGPAFFTKFLYFSTPGALILDNRLANAVSNRSGLPHFVTAKGQSLAWTPYRYAVYLHWMRQVASTLNVPPELLELTLFRPTEDLSDEHDAAD